VALSGTFAQLAAISVVSRFVQYLPTCLAVVVLRHRRPDLPTGFRLPFGPTVPLIAAVACLWLLGKASRTQLTWGLGALAMGALLYLLMKVLTPKTATLADTPAQTTLQEVQQ
jgi:amino acid transporter